MRQALCSFLAASLKVTTEKGLAKSSISRELLTKLLPIFGKEADA